VIAAPARKGDAAMKREMLMLILGGLGVTTGHAADRAIALAPVMTMTWSAICFRFVDLSPLQ
jgi:hypothetical protein